nr:hypothetical protein Iba_chr05bCG1710 [Ipomoea batatas]GMC94903.1 hypothetical protein Iba_chr05cCG3440 [Ipomoea batatas]GMC99044.1 hypothetical protein Iba_chr05eCG1970 [Ipomoea batatas]GMD00833.1 hypothetical protein Iba_chr05fCG1640 [Ipomoea batatas]
MLALVILFTRIKILIQLMGKKHQQNYQPVLALRFYLIKELLQQILLLSTLIIGKRVLEHLSLLVLTNQLTQLGMNS